MRRCPHCDAPLNEAVDRNLSRQNSKPGDKTTGMELVSCTDCGEIIDGFINH